MNEDEIQALHVLALIPIDVCVRGECNGMDWTRRYTEGYSKTDHSALIKGGLPSPLSTQQWTIPLINQWNSQCSWIVGSAILKTDQEDAQSTEGKLAQVTQLQAIEEKLKHLKFSEIWNFIQWSTCFTMIESPIYKLWMRSRLLTWRPNGY